MILTGCPSVAAVETNEYNWNIQWLKSLWVHDDVNTLLLCGNSWDSSGVGVTKPIYSVLLFSEFLVLWTPPLRPVWWNGPALVMDWQGTGAWVLGPARMLSPDVQWSCSAVSSIYHYHFFFVTYYILLPGDLILFYVNGYSETFVIRVSVVFFWLPALTTVIWISCNRVWIGIQEGC